MVFSGRKIAMLAVFGVVVDVGALHLHMDSQMGDLGDPLVGNVDGDVTLDLEVGGAASAPTELDTAGSDGGDTEASACMKSMILGAKGRIAVRLPEGCRVDEHMKIVQRPEGYSDYKDGIVDEFFHHGAFVKVTHVNVGDLNNKLQSKSCRVIFRGAIKKEIKKIVLVVGAFIATDLLWKWYDHEWTKVA